MSPESAREPTGAATAPTASVPATASRGAVALALLGVQFAFASWSIVGKVALGVIPPFALVGVRLLGGGLFFTALEASRGRLALPPRRAWRELIVLTVTGLLCNQVFFTLGLQRTSAIESSILGATIPVATVAYAVATGRERGRPSLWVGLAIALAGAVLVARPERLSLTDQHLVGDLLLLTNCVSYAVYLVRARAVVAEFGPGPTIAWMFQLAAMVMGPIGLAAAAPVAATWGARTWLALAYVVAAPTAFAYGVNAWALRHAPSSLVAVWVYLQPVLAISLALAFGDPLAHWLGVAPPHESLAVAAVAGMAAILTGVTVASRR